MSTVTTATAVNPNTENVAIGHAVIGLIVAQATTREHLRNAITSIQWDKERGVGVLVTDAGARQHLANALGFDRVVRSIRTPFGQGFGREGEILGMPVTIWNVEA